MELVLVLVLKRCGSALRGR